MNLYNLNSFNNNMVEQRESSAVLSMRNGHVREDITGESGLDGVGRGDFDFVPDEKHQALDVTSLYMKDIGQIPMRTEMHEQWGKEIFAGKIALGALEILMWPANCLSEEDRARVSGLLGKKGSFLLKRFHMNIKSTLLRIQDDKYEGEAGERLKNLDTEFLETVSGNEELAKDMLKAWAINEDEDPEESNFHQFLDQQIRLADQGIRSFNDLVEANMRLVPFVTKRSIGFKGMSLAERTSYGNEGLMYAAADYDVRRELRFSNYAMWWIRQKISRGIDERGSMIRVSVGTTKKLRKRKREDNGVGDSEDPSLPDILQSGLRVQSVASLDRPLSGEGVDLTLLDVLEDRSPGVSDIVLNNVSRRDVQRILERVLSPKEKRVIELRLGLLEDTGEMPLEEIGREFGVTRERIRQIQANAFKKLRNSPEAVKDLKALVEP